MSIQLGRWNFDGGPVDRTHFNKVQGILAPYGSDGLYEYSGPGIHVSYHPFHTTKESRCETQPYVSRSGPVFTWDGRLDNRQELVRELGDSASHDAADVSLVAAAHEKWGLDALPRLIGDWALSILDPRNRTLILAKDFLGSRHLYYSCDDRQAVWCTLLAPLVLLAGKSWQLEEEYLAGWLSLFPATHLTPYVGIHSVSPSTFVLLKPGASTVKKYWDFDEKRSVRYLRDSEYEDHFRTVFAQSVRRRLRSEAPVLAELSGGIDSSSIVCMADTLVAQGTAETPRVDTISYFDDSEPNWNERAYFTKVEENRGRPGCHIDVGKKNPLDFEFNPDHFAATPGSGHRASSSATLFSHCLASQNHRVVLSGLGGDEVTGGVPTPVPEIADLLVALRFRTLASQLKLWALAKRKPWFHLILEAAQVFFPPVFARRRPYEGPPPWIQAHFAKRFPTALRGYVMPLRIFGPLPSFQENLSTLDVLRRQLACSPPSWKPPYDKRYPFLDRDLLAFLYAIPREQVIRPRQRRSLMRRALAGMVPEEVLNRKRKAFVARGPVVALSADCSPMVGVPWQMLTSSLGIVNPRALAEALETARTGQQILLVPMLRTLGIEYWLRHLQLWRVSGSQDPLVMYCSSAKETSRTGMRSARTFAGHACWPARFWPFRDNHFTFKLLLISLTLLLLIGAILFAANEDSISAHLSALFTSSPYHNNPPTKPLPNTMDPLNFPDNPSAQVAYSLAAQIPELLYQVPCACPCHKTDQHQSLFDCFRGRHGVNCPACKMEAIFCFEAHKKGMTAAAIRKEIEERRWITIELSQYTSTHPFSPERPPQ